MLDPLSNEPKTITLVDGTSVSLRYFKEGDAEDLLKFYRGLPDEDRMFLKDDVTNRDIFNIFMDKIHTGRSVMILAFHDKKIVAEATLHMNFFGWTRHVAELRAVILREYSGKGLTRALIREQVGVAITKNLDKIVFRILENQKDSRKALEEVGFEQEAVLRRQAMDLQGNKHNVVIMSNYVSELWRQFEDMITDSEFEVIP
jgi:RimJ/RimL family protein N-acetyltransferase